MPLAHLERHERELYFRGYGEGRDRYLEHREASEALVLYHNALSEAGYDCGGAFAYYHEGWVLGWQDARAALMAVKAVRSNVVKLEGRRKA